MTIFGLTITRTPKAPPPEDVITRSTPDDVARAKLSSWRRSDEFAFVAAVGAAMVAADAGGLGRGRMMRVLRETAKELEKVCKP